MSLISLFCKVDDFCLYFEPVHEAVLLEAGCHSIGQRQLSLSEVMTINIFFHQNHYRNCKHFYCDYLRRYHQEDFPKLVSYTRFLELMRDALIPLTVYLKTCCMGRCDGLSFIDSSAITVCDNHRIHSNKVFTGMAARGKTSTVWLYGFRSFWLKGIYALSHVPEKNMKTIEHTHHRSIYNFVVILIAGLIAFTEHEDKPSFDVETMSQLPVAA